MFNVVLFEPEHAGNVGNIARTCAVVGATLHLIRPFGFFLRSPQFARAAMDYLDGVSMVDHIHWPAFLESEQPTRIWGFSSKAQTTLWENTFERGDYLVFGSESRGLSDEVRAHIQTVTLPMPAGGRSLNLATSVGIGVYEALRQVSCTKPL